ncbi:hypothetical protein OAA09_01155 [bacterium]|nr:hypothetical protein [bacterium]
MKSGDTVRQIDDESLHRTQQTWVVTDIKSDSRGLWVKFNDDVYSDMWHDSSYYEVISESR